MHKAENADLREDAVLAKNKVFRNFMKHTVAYPG